MHMLAVVPIVVNAGAAVLPTVVAALASIAAILFRPRELVRLLRKRKLAAGMVAGGLILSSAGAWWWHSLPSVHSARRNEMRAAGRIDWAKVAEDIIAQERLRQLGVNQAEFIAGSAVEPGGISHPTNSGLSPVHGGEISNAPATGGLSPSGLIPAWSFKPEGTLFFGEPAIAPKRIYAAGCQADLGAYTGLLTCLDLDTGKPLWQISEDANGPLRPFFSSPALSGDGKFLVIGQGLHQDRDCSLLCFDTATGKQVWAAKTPLHVESSPAIFGDIAVVGAGAIEGENGLAVGDPGFVLAVDIPSGKTLWKQPVNDPESSPAIDENGIVYIGSGCNGNAVVAMRSDTDEELQKKNLDRVVWKTGVGQPMLAPITLAGRMVIAAGGNGDMVHSGNNPQGLLVALDRQDGKILWQTILPDAVLGAVAFLDGKLICPVRNGEVVALNASDGSVLWRARVSGKAPVLAGCAVTPDRIYAVSNDGYLVALAIGNGQVLEKIYLNDQSQPGTGLTISSPQVTGNRIIVGSESGGLRCLQGTGAGQ
jgi:outer membrane protein assembly factor BamB